MPRTGPGSVAERWASFVLRTLDADYDPTTVADWAKCVGVSRSVLCECCRIVRVPAHDARDFTRLMRAIARSGDRWEPEAVLYFADARTLKRMLVRGGLAGETRVPTIEEFLDRQQWIPAANPGLVALRTALLASAVEPASTERA